MGYTLEEFKIEHAREIVPQKLYSQYSLGLSADSHLNLIEEQTALAITARDREGVIIVCAGIVVPWEGVGEFWSIPSELVRHHKTSYARVALRVIKEVQRAKNLHRLHSFVLVEDARASKFMRWLGFKCEGILECFGANSESYWMFAKLWR
jgi:hypothetical protein